MRRWAGTLMSSRFRALIRKEFSQILRNKRIVWSLILPPILQLTLFTSVLSPTVNNLKLGAVDLSHTPESRELIAQLTQSESFVLSRSYLSADEMGDDIGRGSLDVGVVIPYDFARDLQRGRPTTVQFLLNAMDANTGELGKGYAMGVVAVYNQQLAGQGLHANFQQVAAPSNSRRGFASLMPTFLYNPGLVSAWFVVTGVLGLLLLMNGSITASTAMVQEREAGTLEQLLMTPSSTTEIILAKIAPLFVLLSLMALFGIVIMKVVFDVPFHGNAALFFLAVALCLLTGIGLGTVIATLTSSAQQAQLSTFFMNPLMVSLSGAFSPVQAMPRWMQPFTVINPIYHFGVIARSALIKGSGLEALWPNFLALLLFALAMISASVWRFRRQLR
jgi:ABC-2 type transport system permease protein